MLQQAARRCRAFDLSGKLPLFVPSGLDRYEHVGFVLPSFARQMLEAAPATICTGQSALAGTTDSQSTDALVCLLDHNSAEVRSEQLETLMQQLRADGAIEGWRQERYPIHPVRGGQQLCTVERACATYLGIAQFGVHVNVLTGPREQPPSLMWLAQRAQDKPTWPGMWDNCVGGGLSAGEDPFECAMRECLEEASIPPPLAAQAVWASGTSFAVDVEGKGLYVDYNSVYDVTVPEEFRPRSGDGEVDAFKLVPIEELPAYLPLLYPAAALVVVDFLLRRGHLDSVGAGSGHHMQQYDQLVNSLRLGDELPSYELQSLDEVPWQFIL